VRKFLKNAGHADTYRDLEIQWKNGASPTLIIYDDDDVIEKVNLERYSTKGLHDLMKKKGFVREVSDEEEVQKEETDSDEF